MENSRILQLSPEVIGQIAAGEVVERPAAAIKELVENSMDAGATAITVDIREGGLASFRVADNGSGIQPEDIRLAFSRHATSKIRKAEDLYGVRSLGFRGEALASIAAVAKVTCLTRAKGRENGIMVRNEGGVIQEIQDAACPEGTTFTIKDLFFNAPVRRKFLKKPATETAAVSEMMARMILSHPEISFRFMADQKLVYFSAGDNKLDSAILSIYGMHTLKLLMPIDGMMNGLTLTGYVGVGDASRGNRAHEHFFLNGRSMKSPILSAGVEAGCRQRITIGRFPLCVLHLTLPFENADVNVHPNKWEVRFQDERGIREAMETIVFESLAKTNDAPVIPPLYLGPQDVPGQAPPAHMTVSEPVAPPENGPVAPLPSRDQKYAAFAEESAALPRFHPAAPSLSSVPLSAAPLSSGPSVLRDSGAAVMPPRMTGMPPIPDKPLFPLSHAPAPFAPAFREEAQQPAFSAEQPVPPQEAPSIPQPAMEEEAPASLLPFDRQIDQTEVSAVAEKFDQVPIRLIGVAFKTYIILEYGDLLVLCDQHAVHERVLYERFIRETATSPASQAMMVPQLVQLSKGEYAAYEENQEVLKKAGFDLAPFGEDTVQLRGVPIILGQPQAEKCLMEALDELMADPASSVADRTARVIQMSCKHAIKGGEWQSDEAILALMRDVIEKKVTPTCPHGRPLMVQISHLELDKRFRRIQGTSNVL